MRVAILYALGYLYEHREEADHHSLTLFAMPARKPHAVFAEEAMKMLLIVVFPEE